MKQPVKYEHRTPSSLQEAKERRASVAEEIENIQFQLGDRDKTSPLTGERMDSIEYWEWRKKAKLALRYRTSELRYLNQWINGNNLPDSLTSLLRSIIGVETLSEQTLLLVMQNQKELIGMLRELEDKILTASEVYLSKKEASLPVTSLEFGNF